MITKLKIKNIQSHGKNELTFHSGVNVIVGNSDAGKSAIIRALRWLIWNRPSGDSIRSNWGGETSVEVDVDGNVITRSRDKVDKYQIQQGEQTLDFKAIGTSVPEEVSRLLNVNEINLQLQLDNPYLLSDSPGEVAVHFNQIARLDKIDTGLGNVNSAIRSLGNEITYGEASEVVLQGQLKEFEYLDKMEAEVEVLEQMENQLRGMKSSLDNLQLKLYDYSENERFMDDYKNLLSDEERVNAVLELCTKRNKLEEQANSLGKLMSTLFLVQDDIEDAQETVKDESKVNALIGLYNSKNKAVEGLSTLNKLLSNLTYTNSDINKKTLYLASLEAKFKKEFPDVCPLCGNIIKK